MSDRDDLIAELESLTADLEAMARNGEFSIYFVQLSESRKQELIDALGDFRRTIEDRLALERTLREFVGKRGEA
jgi:hypothetical protein